MNERGTQTDSHAHGGLDYLSELPQARPHIHETRKFPDGFLWGSASASHQVEGGTDNDWTEWEKIPGHILDGTRSGRACEHYDRYEEDFDIAKSMHQNAQRISIEWSRIEPEEGKWDMDAIIHYRKVLQSLRDRDLQVMLTCWHFTLPKWFAAKGGWESPDAIDRFVRYVELLATEYGDMVDLWITINEPMVYLLQSYGAGIWPPGVANPIRSVHVFGKMTIAHRRAHKAIHRILDVRGGRKAQVGIAQNVITFEPYRKHSFADTVFVWGANRLFNHQFFLWSKPSSHDFIGINYYFHYRMKVRPTKAAQFFYEVHTENREVSDLGWEINAPGIFDAIMEMAQYRKPIYISEHGVANADDGKRPRIIVAALKEVYHAIKAGVDIRGYFHWSLTDNFEWEKGFSGRFGLVAIDYATMKRTPRRSAYVYAEICKENGIPHTLLRYMGHGVRW